MFGNFGGIREEDNLDVRNGTEETRRFVFLVEAKDFWVDIGSGNISLWGILRKEVRNVRRGWEWE